MKTLLKRVIYTLMLALAYMLQLMPGHADTESALLSHVLTEDEIALWWRVRTFSTTADDRTHALNTLVEQKLIRGVYPVPSDWYYLLYMEHGKDGYTDESYRRLARAALMLRVLDIVPNYHQLRLCYFSREGAKMMKSCYTHSIENACEFVFQFVRVHDVYDWDEDGLRKKKRAEEPTVEELQQSAVRYLATTAWHDGRYYKFDPNKLTAEQINTIIDSARGHESLHLLFNPKAFNPELDIPDNWKEKAQDLINKGCPVHVSPHYKLIVRDFDEITRAAGCDKEASLMHYPNRSDTVDALYRGEGSFAYGNNYYDYYPDFGVYDNELCDRAPISPIYLPEANCIIENSLLYCVYYNSKLPILKKLEIMEFLIQQGAPPYISTDIMETSPMWDRARFEKRPAELYCDSYLVTELLLNYGGFYRGVYNPHSGEHLYTDSSAFIILLAAYQQGEDRKHTMELIKQFILHHPYMDCRCLWVSWAVQYGLTEEECIDIAKDYFRRYGKNSRKETLQHWRGVAEKKGYTKLVKIIDKALNKINDKARK